LSERSVAPFGSWVSPISAEMLASSGLALWAAAVRWDGGALWWVEGRPTEEGRNVLVRGAPDGEPVDLTPPGFDARTRVHEYGGGAFGVADGVALVSNFADQRLYRVDGPGLDPRPITPEPPSPASLRYADGVFTPDGRWFVCVRERHEGSAATDVVNEIVALATDGSGEAEVLATGRDFYAFPRLSPDARRLAWTAWDHPNMPWDGTELFAAELEPSGPGAGGDPPQLGAPQRIAGGPGESVFQPAWSPEGILHLVSDRTGWWNLYRERDGEVAPLYPMDAEFGRPQWVFGLSTYAFLPDGRIACIWSRDAIDHLAVLDPATGELAEVPQPYTTLGYLAADGEGRLAVVGSSATEPPTVAVVDPEDGAVEVLRRSEEVEVDPAYFSVPEPIEFPTEGGHTAHALFYRPTNPTYAAPDGEQPPLLVLSHGGPTSHVSATLDLEIQYFTSRGFAVVDVNYGGSTGYGREYRARLRGAWGVVDLQDCVNAARYLAERGEVDGGRLAIRGGSAGGYTTLCALVFTDAFAAGASYYGVADCAALAGDTHKFESRYLDGLIGPWPEAEAIYRERSPIHHVDRLSTPVILFQGLEDAVVPPAQAEMMVEALARKGIYHAYLAFEGEQHGFRKADTIRRCAEAELSFYGQVLGFEPADHIEPVDLRINVP
jgi:dipeptidyl aminopeptidase/acylaminoacyl peptidase